MIAAPECGRGRIFAPYGTEALDLPDDLEDRPGWREWRGDAEVRLWHHATDVDEPFSIFARQDEGSIGFHFGTHAAACERHRIMFRMGDPAERHQDGYMLSVLVRCQRPLRVPDKYSWDMDEVASELVHRGLLEGDEEDEILESCDIHSLFAAIERAGHDAILYPNETEGCNDGRQDSILVWRAAQIRSVHASHFVSGDPRLCPSLSSTPEEWQWWTENERGIDQWLRHFETSQERRRCLHA